MSQSTISLPHPLAVCVSRIEAALDEAAGTDPMYLSTSAKQEVLLALTRVATRVDGLRLTVMANAGDVAAETGARSVGSWVAHETRVDPPAAAADAKLASSLETKYAQVRAGVLSGRVNLAQARVIVAALDELPARIGADVRAEAEARLVAEAEHFDPRRLRVLGRRILDIVAPEVAEDEERRRLEEEERQARAHTRLFFKNLGAGRSRVVIDLPEATAGIFKTLLHAYTSPRRDHLGPDDGGAVEGETRLDPDTGERIPYARLLGQAFCALVEHVPTDRLPSQGSSPVAVVATIDQERLAAQLGAAGLSTGDTISAGEARRLACAHKILPAVLDGASQVLDLGRGSRLFTASQRRALELRHPTCQTTGCSIPAAWCEAHHRVPFSKGGRTDLADGAMLCPFHHHRAHDRLYDQTWHPDGSVRFHRRR